MLHPAKVLHALFWRFRSTVRRALEILGLKARPKRPVSAPTEALVARFRLLCDWLQRSVPEEAWHAVNGAAVCEIGPGECLATGALVLGRGAAHLDLVEHDPPITSLQHVEILEQLSAHGLQLDKGIIQMRDTAELNPAKATFHRCFMEAFLAEDKYALIYSLNVLEHVEQLDAFFRSCYRAVKPGGWAVHIIDLGGHSEFEEPVPQLDFQTYPDWLYGLMFPPYHRATRRFVGDYRTAMEKAGFMINEVRPITTVPTEYVRRIWPKLRAAARKQAFDEISLIEFALVAKKP